MKRDAVMFGLSLINPLERGFGLVAGTGRSVAVGEVTGLAREAGAAGVARAVTGGEASVLGLFNKVGMATSADIDAALLAKMKTPVGPGETQSVAKNGASSQVQNSTVRENVLTNIEASPAGPVSSNFATFARREALTNEALVANQSPWPLGYPPTIRPMTVGEQFNMVIDANQAQGLRGPGGFGTFSDIPSQPFARDTLAITEQFKSDISLVQRYEVVQPFNALQGPIGPQIDQVTGRLLEGSKTTWQLDLQLPPNQRVQYLKPVGAPVPLAK
jgi:hypothetical protein